MKSFETAVVESSMLQKQKPIYVKLMSVYHAHVPYGKDGIRQLEMEKVLEVEKR